MTRQQHQNKAPEDMTRNEFEEFQQNQVDDYTNEFIANIRNAIICCNENGEFIQYRISPAVLTDDFVLKATQFIQISCKNYSRKRKGHAESQDEKEDTPPPLTIELVTTTKMKGYTSYYEEGWLNLRASTKTSTTNDSTTTLAVLPLVMFTKKRDDKGLVNCLDQIIMAVHKVILTTTTTTTTTIPHPNITVTALSTTQELWQKERQDNYPKNNQWADTHQDTFVLQEALGRIQTLKARGASKTEIKAEMKRIRAERKKMNTVTTTTTNRQNHDKAKMIGGGMDMKALADAAIAKRNEKLLKLEQQQQQQQQQLENDQLQTMEEGSSNNVVNSKYNKKKTNVPRLLSWSWWETTTTSSCRGREQKHHGSSTTTLWIWKGVLATLAIYYIYTRIR